MPVKTPEQLKERVATLRKKLHEKAASLDGPKLRAVKKRIRRAQRRRRTLLATASRSSGLGKDKEKKEG